MPLKDLDIIQYNASGNMLVSVATKNGEVKGVKNLIQRVIKRIFTVQGSNTYDLQLGGQLNTLFKAITEEEAQEFEETFGILLNSFFEPRIFKFLNLISFTSRHSLLPTIIVFLPASILITYNGSLLAILIPFL